MEAAMIVLESILEREQRAFTKAFKEKGPEFMEWSEWAKEIESIRTTMLLLQEHIDREQAVRAALHVKRGS